MASHSADVHRLPGTNGSKTRPIGFVLHKGEIFFCEYEILFCDGEIFMGRDFFLRVRDFDYEMILLGQQSKALQSRAVVNRTTPLPED